MGRWLIGGSSSPRATTRPVFFVPGNHDVWLPTKAADANKQLYHVDQGGVSDSLEKLHELLQMCDELGVGTRPQYSGGAIVVPMLSWRG